MHDAILALLLVALGPTQEEGLGTCRTAPSELWTEEARAFLRERQRARPARKVAPIVRATQQGGAAIGNCLTSAQIHVYEDVGQLILGPFSFAAWTALMTDAANEVLALYGDNFDYVGFVTNSDPNMTLGPFFIAVSNDVAGIGDPSGVGTPIFDNHMTFGLNGARIQGYLMMTDVNILQPGTAPAADLTRLLIAHEFEHRFATFLPDLLDGRALQGPDGFCGRSSHWNWSIDAQGSAMEISEWTGAAPATFASLNGFRNESFNTDTGGLFSYPDLYLMGYVTGAEMDAGASELRYMDASSCGTTHGGSISSWTSADLIASAGVRSPDAATAQKHFRTAWVMVHLPGDPPDQAELDRLAAILQQSMIDWNEGTLGRGSMDNTLFDECNTLMPYGCGVNPANSLTVPSGLPQIGRTLTFAVHNPLGTQPPGSLAILSFATAPDANFPCGTTLGGFGMAGGSGELLVSLSQANKLARVSGPWTGAPRSFPVSIPADTALLGASFYAQGLILDPSSAFGVRFGLTEGIEAVIGP